MRLSTMLDYSRGIKESADHVADLERAGLDIVWVAEAYGLDGPSQMGYIAARTERVEIGSAILPIYSRTPALLAQTAAGIDALSDGRFILGLGASGPQVIEGWHGVPYTQPLERTREIIGICRKVWRREVVRNEGLYPIPLPEGRGTGLGKPLKLINHPVRAEIPIWVASMGPKNVEMTAELANGWFPFLYMPERAQEVWGDALGGGACPPGTRARAAGDRRRRVGRRRGGARAPARAGPAHGRPLHRGDGRGAGTSTTPWRAATGSRRRPRSSRTCT